MTAIAVLHKDEILKRVAKGDKISRNKIFECPLLAQSRRSIANSSFMAYQLSAGNISRQFLISFFPISDVTRVRRGSKWAK